MTTIYALSCEGDKWYIGRTDRKDVNDRVIEHFNQHGSAWTKKYPPLAVDHIWNKCSPFDEDKYTLVYMTKYGVDNVRGGSYVQVNLSSSQIDVIEKQIANAKGVCFHCGKAGHFIRQCPEKSCQKCGRSSHTADKCYAKTKFDGSPIEEQVSVSNDWHSYLNTLSNGDDLFSKLMTAVANVMIEQPSSVPSVEKSNQIADAASEKQRVSGYHYVTGADGKRHRVYNKPK